MAILLPRNTERLYSSQLGILKAGGAYASIDPAFPDGRIVEILQDSGAVALLTDAAGAARAKAMRFAGRILMVDALPPSKSAAPALPDPHPDNLAYVIYTSGTTGRPKGVMIEHRNIVNLVAADMADFGVSPADRISQNSSPVYDSSVEEIWMAFAAGATLVVMDEDAARLGPDLVPWVRRERLTMLCPTPTMLRAMACEHPDVELPELATIYTGGEAVPQDLADRWSKGRRMINGYGPTECAVTATRGDLHPGEPVSIGGPVPGIEARVLDEALAEVAEGEWGELCLGGAGLARGYRNRPEQTAEKFIVHPRFGRIYRTGDLVHRAADGSIFYHGRADTQVKIRGYRIELEEIEMRLSERKGVRAAACTVQDGALVAFVVPENGWAAEGFEALAVSLRRELPDYMIPTRFGTLSVLPLTPGGKLNRAALPPLQAQARSKNGVAARNAREADLADVFRAILGLEQPVPVDSDFFTDLGGNSLRAAQLITRLRERDAATQVTVRDLYETRTVMGLAERLTQPILAAPENRSPDQVMPSATVATLVQAIWLLAGFSIAALVSYWGVFDAAPLVMRSLGLISSLLLSPVWFLGGVALYTPLAVCGAAVLKRCLIGRYRPLRAPVWGSFYVRNWMVQQAVRAIPWRMLEGTGFQNMALRALGARIGRRVHIHRGVNLAQGGWDLLDIGDDVTISQEANIGLVELEEGHILVRPVFIGDGCTLDIRAGVEGGSRMEAGAYLTAHSWLPPGERIPGGERWDGIPARASGYAPARAEIRGGEVGLPPFLHDLLMVVGQCLVGFLPALLPELAAAGAAATLGVDGERVAAWIYNPVFTPALLLAGLALVILGAPITLTIEAWMVRGMGRVREGVIGRWSLDYFRVRLKSEILESAAETLSGSLFWPVWLRWAGMRIGRGCEISSILDTVPELVDIGDRTFFADGIYVGGPRLHRGTVTLATTYIGSGVFLGNHVVIPAGRSLPDNSLLGVCTVANEAMEGGRSWFGHPPFELPRREVVQWDASQTFRPTPMRYLSRLFWELLRFALPIPTMLAALAWLWVVSAAAAGGTWLAISLAVCGAGLGVDGALCLLALAAKWSLVGRVRPGQHPFWACWCGRWDYMYVTWENWARGTMLHLEGTLLLSWYLRAMGMRIGKRVVLGPGFSQVVDPDMLIIEDDATVNAQFQAHTFEDRVLKMDYVHVRKGATVGTATVPLYGSDIGANAYVAPHSVVMKGEHLLPGVHYEGAPTQVRPRGMQVAAAVAP